VSRRSIYAAGAVVSAVVAGMAHADTINITSEGGTSTSSLGSFTGVVEFNADGFAGGADLSFKLTNTSPASNGGYLTGFVFNVAKDGLTVSYADPDGNKKGFDDLNSDKALKANPFGTFEEGAALGGVFLGGGSPLGGIGVGQTREFLFNVVGDLTGVSALTFLSEESTPTGNHDGEVFVARFKGFFNDGSDKVVPGEVLLPPPPPPPPQVVPVPMAAWGGGMLLAGLGAARAARRRRMADE
jgi:MYXO-CTERM domain-containing protein